LLFQSAIPGISLDLAYKIGAGPGATVSSSLDGSVTIVESLTASASTSTASQLGTGTLVKNDTVTLFPIDVADAILKNSMHVGPNPANKAEMTATFQPQNGFTLKQAAEALGFDHFNWVQRITHIPLGWSLGLWDIGNGTEVWRAEVDQAGNLSGFIN